jgi:hypothetical protein
MKTLQPFENILFAQLAKAADGIGLKENPDDRPDTVTMDIPLLMRVLEMAREDVKDDMDLHHAVERMLKIKNKPILSMSDYDYIAGKADLDQTVKSVTKPEPEMADLKKLAGLS